MTTEGQTMTDPKLQTDEARQGETGYGVRWILGISVIAAIFAMGILIGTMI
ncbi:hypothetical protein [Henriciella aquimarina]|uniref:hypothetical protein n=1 Tax=Henriciella aquimarina TaxID=545261 RepID=UPI001301E0EA|nr:hypothetical protein [Henriciella aquimarina]